MIIYIYFTIIALRRKLECFFEEVTIQYVECPDLTKPPYRFTAPGNQLSNANFLHVKNAISSYYIYRIMRQRGTIDYRQICGFISFTSKRQDI